MISNLLAAGANGVLWDLIAAYPAGPVWSNTVPRPVFFDGTMVQSAAGLEGVISNAKQPLHGAIKEQSK